MECGIGTLSNGALGDRIGSPSERADPVCSELDRWYVGISREKGIGGRDPPQCLLPLGGNLYVEKGEARHFWPGLSQ